MNNIKRSDVLLVFTYAIAGFGHLRVTDALYDGLPEGVNSVPIGADDTNITYLHRLMSVNSTVKLMVDWFEQEKREQWFDRFYIWTLKLTTKHLYHQMEHLVSQQWHEKKIVVVISTHFGLAHQMAEIKERLEKNLNIKLILVVQVTDATTMKIWYVQGADLISVPSEKVKKELVAYAEKRRFKQANIAVLPYPLDKAFAKKLSDEEYQLRLRQCRSDTDLKIKVAIPISGAAVGLSYYDKLIAKLAKSSERFHFYLVIKRSIFTVAFIKKMETRSCITVIESETDKGTVDNYEKLYESEVIALEIVKPSEQAFKALIKPDQRGGSILLFTQPVGRQEQDNLDFLTEHRLISKRAQYLTNNINQDVRLINQWLESGVFEQMAKDVALPKDNELASDGVQQFWEKVNDMIGKV